MQPLVLVGAGGFGRETAELVGAVNDSAATWDLLGFLDDDASLHGGRVGAVPVIGPIDWISDHDDVMVALCVGHPGNFASRARLAERLALHESRYATLIHPAAVVARSATVGPGTVVHATTVLTADVEIRSHVAIMPGVVLTHDDRVCDFATFGAGVRLAGGVTVGRGAYLGSGAMVRENVEIGEWSLVGMGSVVTRSIAGGGIWAGAPARYVRPSPHVDRLEPASTHARRDENGASTRTEELS